MHPVSTFPNVRQCRCANNQTLGPPSTSNTFTLLASAPGTDFDELPVEASGGHFYIGGGPSTYCPQFVPAGMCPAGNETVFAGSALVSSIYTFQQSALTFSLLFIHIPPALQPAKMFPSLHSTQANPRHKQDVEVPGGQQIYLAPNGYISFTAAHSISYPTGSIFAGFDIKGGEASTFAGYSLFACPVVGQPPPYYQVVANITGVPSTCKSLLVLAETFTGGFGAWQYA